MISLSTAASAIAFIDTRRVAYSSVILSLAATISIVIFHILVMEQNELTATTATRFFFSEPQNSTTKTSSPSTYWHHSNGQSLNFVNNYNHNNNDHNNDQEDYDWQLSTEENYRSNDEGDNNDHHYNSYGKFRTFRKRLDRSYHTNYICARQAFQDSIIESFLQIHQEEQQQHQQQHQHQHQQQQQPTRRTDDVPAASKDSAYDEQHSHPTTPDISTPSNEKECTEEEIVTSSFSEKQQEQQEQQQPWIIFTAGVYGAGKSHTIQRLQADGCFPSNYKFVSVDPDEIRQRLPEFSTYVAKTPYQAGELTQKEAGMIAELLTDAALDRNKNVLVDGSLKDAVWYENYFSVLRQSYPRLKIGIVYVTAPTEEIYKRVQQRGKSTGRSIPMDALQRSIEEVPKAVQRLRNSVDFFLEVYNSQQQQQQQQQQQGPTLPSFSSLENKHASSSTITKTTTTTFPRSSDIENIMFQEKCSSIG